MKKQRGYVAIVSAIIISSILSLVVFDSSASVFFARFSQLDSEDKTRSKTLAFSCAYEALYAYAEDHSYAPHHQIVEIDQTENGIPEKCTIDKIIFSGTNLTIFVHASLFNAYTVLEIKASSTPLSITSWREVTSIPP